MKLSKVIEKGAEGLLTVIISIFIANIPQISAWAASLIPEEIATLTVAGFVAFLIKAAGNWLKHLQE